MLKYREEHNHRWAHNLNVAKKYFEQNDLERFYNGELNDSFPFPGMKILAAFWVAEDMEMKERLSIHLDVLDIKNHKQEYEILSDEYYRWFVEDFIEMSKRFLLFSDDQLNKLVAISRKENKIPEDFETEIRNLQSQTEEMISNNKTNNELLDSWFFFCGRFILSYAHNLIRQGTITALFVKYNSQEALKKAIEPTIEYFSWKINRIFFNIAMPQTGFEDLGDIVSLGAYGMLADQKVSPSTEEIIDSVTKKRSYLDTCQLYGFIDSVADFMNQPKGSTTCAYCQFCVGHGRTTMHFVVPPDRSVKYSLEKGLGYGDNGCVFLLETEEKEDDARCEEAQMKIFGDEELSYNKIS